MGGRTADQVAQVDLVGGVLVCVEGDVVADAGVLVVQGYGDVAAGRSRDRAFIEGQVLGYERDCRGAAGRNGTTTCIDAFHRDFVRRHDVGEDVHGGAGDGEDEQHDRQPEDKLRVGLTHRLPDAHFRLLLK